MGILLFKTNVYHLFWNPQDIRKPFRGEPKLLDHHKEDQEDQGHLPSRIKEAKY